MAKMKTFDAIMSQADTEVGVATMIGRTIKEAEVSLQDTDDACLKAGKDFGNWVLALPESEIFKKNIRAILGSGKFNEEFFLDGFNEAIDTRKRS